MTELTIPIVMLNGSGRALLREAYVSQIDAVQNAIVALQSNGPHGRDYPDQPTWRKAATEHKARITRLNAVLGELVEIGEAI
jgi:hypothetical protein